MQREIIIDLDGTFSNSSHRKHFMEQKPKDWKSFYEGILYDPVNVWCLEFVNMMLQSEIMPLFVTGRPEKYREATITWLFRFLLDKDQIVFMRKDKDFRSDTDVKKEIYETEIKEKYEVLFCIDDRPKVARMWRDLGLTCLQCNDKEF